MFADDCVVYTCITDEGSSTRLQCDLNRIEQWCKKWKMELNVKKCAHVSFTRKTKTKVETCYQLNNETVTKQQTVKYLGVTLSADCTWNAHINDVVMRAGRALGFLKRNLRKSTKSIKELVYLSYVRPVLEYACTVWDPSQQNHIVALERIQSCAARFVLVRYGRFESVTDMIKELGWSTLALRRRNLRLKFLYNIYNNKTGINSSFYLLPPNYISKRKDHIHKIREYRTRTELGKHSFFVKTIKEWNALPSAIVCAVNSEMFFSEFIRPLR